jgi:2-polyprenyl-3-methyl-5-hydroxy-6-metoxy-1,4-benzoquinol methylase
VVEQLKSSTATRVLDLGCGEGNLLRILLKQSQFAEIVAMDVTHRALDTAAERLRLDRTSDRERERVQLRHGSLTYRDPRLLGFDAAAVVEVIAHLDPPRLEAFSRILFERIQPATVVMTTPNAQYNAVWTSPTTHSESLRPAHAMATPITARPIRMSRPAAGTFRHRDHRIEWTRSEFEWWASAVASRFHYSVAFLPIGPDDPLLGSPTQMAVFRR